MMFHQTHVSETVCKAVGTVGPHYQREVEYYLRRNGSNWVAKRYKAIWTAALHLYNQDVDKAIAIYQQNSIAYHRGRAIPVPKGVVGIVVMSFIQSTRPAAIRRWSALLRMYTGLEATLSPSMIEKTVRSIRDKETTKGPQIGSPGWSADTGRVQLNIYRKHYPGSQDPSWKSLWCNNVSIKAMVAEIMAAYFPISRDLHEHAIEHVIKPLQCLRGSSHYYTPLPKSPVIETSQKKWQRSMFFSMKSSPYYPSALIPFHFKWDSGLADYLSKRSTGRYIDDTVGQIAFLTSDGGGKVRPIAMPNAWTQMAFVRLHEKLHESMVQLEEICVPDQLVGVEYAADVMKHGGFVYSVDLTAATDRLPREIQTRYLTLTGNLPYAQALEEVSSGKWLYKSSRDTKAYVSYAVGQPMGLYGSFPLLNMTNWALAELARMSVTKALRGEDKWNRLQSFAPGARNRDGKLLPNQRFYILGDDVIFFDRRIAEKYIELLEILGVEVASSKSFDKDVAQFAGFNILRNRSDREIRITAYQPYKFPVSGSITNPISLMGNLGAGLRRISPRWERLQRAFSMTVCHRRLNLSPDMWQFIENRSIPDSFTDGEYMLSINNEIDMALNGDTTRVCSAWLKAVNAFVERNVPVFRDARVAESFLHQEFSQQPSRLYSDEKKLKKSLYGQLQTAIRDDPLMRKALEELDSRTSTTDSMREGGYSIVTGPPRETGPVLAPLLPIHV